MAGDDRDRTLPTRQVAPFGDMTLPTQTAASSPAATTVADPMLDATLLERGDMVDRYVVLEEIGRGGMGVIYRAYDPELDRSVALKLLRVRADGEEGTERASARMLREAKAMARLSHPNVIAVYDAGMMADQVFIAMELVEGVSLSHWQKHEKPNQSEILRAYIAAAQGLAAAHQAGLVHRDFKPNNVILGRDGRVRVIDFGLVKALDDEVPETPDLTTPSNSSTPFDAPITRAGLIVGTPKYMAPEQLRAGEVDERTDQFCFCIALYQALYGERPFDGGNLPDLTMNVTRGNVRPAPARARVPKRLRRVLLRGLSPDPADRFPSMSALIRQLRRKPGRRRSLLMAAALAATVAGTAGYLASEQLRQGDPSCTANRGRLDGVWDAAVKSQVQRAFLASKRPHASATFTRVAKRLDDYAASWQRTRTEVCKATYVRKTDSERMFDLRTACLDRRLESVRALTALWARDNDGAVVDRAVDAASRLGVVSDCQSETMRLSAVEPPADEAVKKKVWSARKRLAAVEAQLVAGRYETGLRDAKAAVAEVRAIAYPPLVAEALLLRGRLEDASGKAKAAEKSLIEAINIASQARDDRLVASAWTQLVWVVAYAQARHGELKALRVGATSAVQRAGSPSGVQAQLLSNLASVAYARAHYDEATDLWTKALAMRSGMPLAEHDVAATLGNLGLVFYRKGDFARALDFHRQALALRQATYGPKHPLVARTYNNLGIVAERRGEYDVAIRHYERSLTIKEETLGAEHPSLANALNNLGAVYLQTGEPERARRLLARALRMKVKAHGPDHPRVGTTLDNLGLALVELQQYAAASKHFERSLAISAKTLPADHPDMAHALTGLGESLLGAGAAAAAVRRLEHALRIRVKHKSTSLEVAESRAPLARALWKTGDKARSLRLARQASTEFQRAGAAGARGKRRIDAWLAKRRGMAPTLEASPTGSVP